MIRSLLDLGGQNPAFSESNNRYFGTTDGEFFQIQHHPDQFLGYLSLSGVDPSRKLASGSNQIAIIDLLRDSQWSTTLRGEELSWKTIAYCCYQNELGVEWKNKFSETITLESVVEKLLAQEEIACLGTHKTMAIVCYSNLQRRAEGNTSTTAKVIAYLDKKLEEIRTSQRSDGAFDIPAELVDQRYYLSVGTDILYTGHTLEYLMALESTDPTAEWVRRAVYYLCLAIGNRKKRFESLDFGNEKYCSEFGQLCHAIAGLRRWQNRISQMEILHVEQ
ncbi:MAG: hypothetical protein R3C03_23700 [Pirellulaceae bacterium]